jgi:hypothetical protein
MYEMQKHTRKIHIALLVGAVLLSSCILTGETSTALPTTSAAARDTLSPSPNMSVKGITPSPLIETTISPTLTSPMTQTPTLQPTATLVPALSGAEAEGLAIDLLRDNGGCRLPCFWGFIPQQTSQDTLDSFFHAFYNIGGRRIFIPRNNSTIKISTTWYYSDDPHAVVRWIKVFMSSQREINLPDGTVDQEIFDNPFFTHYIHYYTLPSLLSNYGVPSKAYIGIDPGAEMGFENILHLFLAYSESGWGVQFRMRFKQEHGFYKGCPAQAFTSLFLWSPENVSAATENQAWIDEFGIYFKSIEEATSLSLQEFYQRFKDSSHTPCLETPVDIWFTSK